MLKAKGKCSTLMLRATSLQLEAGEDARLATLSNKLVHQRNCTAMRRMCVLKKLCTDPITVDSTTFKTILAINKQFPGPTLIVREGQIVAVDVHNNLSTEGITVHWHGQHQMKTNFMDGVGLVTQCPIQPGSSFRYILEASPSGTFWYHSQMGSQRANGLFGALIVKKKELKYIPNFICG